MKCTRADSCCWDFEEVPTKGCDDPGACGCKIVVHDYHSYPLGIPQEPVKISDGAIVRAAAMIVDARRDKGHHRFGGRFMGDVFVGILHKVADEIDSEQ